MGGAHRDVDLATENLRKALLKNLDDLDAMTIPELQEKRYHRLRQYGVDNFQE
ncbi:acetyl-coenzyme A carboxylase carboxyl transferase subunit alpha [bacterium BMS3Bbin11]|nr:acetyl-coenzyme A carboxylase carboxyl transferase subunit alpha [bacterium BMS3Bbin11]